MIKTVTLEVCAPSEAMADFVHTGKTGKHQKSARIGFATPELRGALHVLAGPAGAIPAKVSAHVLEK